MFHHPFITFNVRKEMWIVNVYLIFFCVNHRKINSFYFALKICSWFWSFRGKRSTKTEEIFTVTAIVIVTHRTYIFWDNGKFVSLSQNKMRVNGSLEGKYENSLLSSASTCCAYFYIVLHVIVFLTTRTNTNTCQHMNLIDWFDDLFTREKEDFFLL